MKMKGNLKHFSLSLLGAGQNKDTGAVRRRYLPRLNYLSNLGYKILLCDCNEIVKKAMALVGKTTTLRMPHFFVPFFAIYYDFCMTITWHAHFMKECVIPENIHTSPTDG